MLADVSRSTAADAIEKGLVLLDGEIVTARSQRVGAGQVIEIDESIDSDPKPIAADASVQVEVMYVDADVIVINKAAGTVVHPGAGNEMGTIVQGLLCDFPELADIGERTRPGVVHRLDRGTTGVLAVARSERAYQSLSEQLRDRSAHRRYVTLAWGAPDARDGVIDAPIGRAIRDPTRMVVKDDGKPARTRYCVVAIWDSPSVAWLECELDTGRTHQIRVHLEAIGHPVVGDGRYSGGRTGIDFDRPALHAAELGFTHPASGETMSFTAPVPHDLTVLLESLGRPNWGSVQP